MENDIKWHDENEAPEKKGVILVMTDARFYDVWYWVPFTDLKHTARWVDTMCEPPCGKIKKWARIK